MISYRRLAALIVLFGIAGSLWAQAVLKDLRFTPPTFFVGDEVTLLIEFEVTGSMAVEPPASIPESDWVDIRSVDVRKGDGSLEVIIAFTPFAPGTRTLPNMELGSLQLVDIKIPTYSILQNTHDNVRSLRGQLMLPGTRLAVALILAIVAMAPFLGYGLFRIIWEKVRQFREKFRFSRPERKIRRLLKKLHGGIGTVSAPLWYSELTDGLRGYLSFRTRHDCRSATTAEIARMEEFRRDEATHRVLLAVLKDGDMVKFAGRFADDRTMRTTLLDVEGAIQDWEKSNAQL